NTNADKISVMPPVSPVTALDTALAALAAGVNRDPFGVLGPHVEDGDRVIRAFNPAASAMAVRLVDSGELRQMTGRGPSGVFEAHITNDDGQVRLGTNGAFADYRLR